MTLLLNTLFFRVVEKRLSYSSDRLQLTVRYRQQIILLHEKSIVSPTERSENATAFSKLAEKGLRFSMKMMFAPGSESPRWLV